jgi:uncharacterized membrane protein YbhN (UPF0104 family)
MGGSGHGADDASRVAVAGVLAGLSAVPLGFAVALPSGPLRIAAYLTAAILWLAAALVAWAYIKVHWRWRRRLTRLRQRLLERRYGKPIPFAAGQRVIQGRSAWFWVCPYCETSNEGSERCSDCAAVLDPKRFRARKAPA